MKKLALIIGLIVAVNISFSQGKKGNKGGQRKEKGQLKIEEHKERLQLSDTQVEDLRKLRKEIRSEMKAIQANKGQTRSDKMRAKADLMKKNEVGRAKVLNDEQVAELKKIREEGRKKMKGKRHRKTDDGNR